MPHSLVAPPAQYSEHWGDSCAMMGLSLLFKQRHREVEEKEIYPGPHSMSLRDGPVRDLFFQGKICTVW